MKNVQSTQHGGVWLAAVMSFVLLAAVLAHGEVQAAAVTSGVLTPQDMSVDECRSRMMANAKTLAENRTITAEDAVFPTDEVFASLSPSEKKSVGAGCRARLRPCDVDKWLRGGRVTVVRYGAVLPVPRYRRGHGDSHQPYF